MAGGLVGYVQWALLMITSLHIWALAVVGLLLSFLKSPHTFFRRKPRSLDDFPDVVPGLEHEYHIVNGVKLHVVIAGKAKAPGAKRLLLCVHGFPESHISWRHQLQGLSADYEVAAIDLRGYGRSERPRGRSPYRVAEMVQDLVELIPSLGHSKCVLVGHDWGAAIAWRFAQFHQDLLHALVCLAAPPGKLWMQNQTPEQKRKLTCVGCSKTRRHERRSSRRTSQGSSCQIADRPNAEEATCCLWCDRSAYVWMFQMPLVPELLIAARDYAAIEDVFVGQEMGVKRQGAISAEDVERYKANMQQPYALTAGLNFYRAAVDAATWNPPPRSQAKPALITVRTLFIGGEQDGALTKSLFTRIGDIVRDPEMHWLPDCSHWVQQEQPEKVNSLVTRFLAAR